MCMPATLINNGWIFQGGSSRALKYTRQYLVVYYYVASRELTVNICLEGWSALSSDAYSSYFLRKEAFFECFLSCIQMPIFSAKLSFSELHSSEKTP